MIGQRMTLALIFATTNLFVGCTDDPAKHSPVKEMNSGVKFEFSAVGDVAAMEVVIQRVSCNGESIEPFSLSEDFNVGDAARTITDAFIHLDPGCYDVTISPLTANGSPSIDCGSVSKENLMVIEGTTTELGFVMQCFADPVGGLDLSAKTNADATSAKFSGKRIACENEAVNPQVYEETASVNTPGQTILETMFVVPPGCYEIRIEPRKSDGTSSDTCAPVTISDVVVIDGYTTEIGTEFVCP